MLLLTASLLGGLGWLSPQATTQSPLQEWLSMPPQEKEASAQTELPWFHGSYDALMAKAKSEGKLVFLDFWTEW